MQLKLSAARPFLRLRLRHSDVVSRHAYCIRNLHANSPTKRLENGLLDSSALSKFSPEELETALVLADCPDWEEKEMKQKCFR